MNYFAVLFVNEHDNFVRCVRVHADNADDAFSMAHHQEPMIDYIISITEVPYNLY